MNCGYCDELFLSDKEGYILLLFHQIIWHGKEVNECTGTNITQDCKSLKE